MIDISKENFWTSVVRTMAVHGRIEVNLKIHQSGSSQQIAEHLLVTLTRTQDVILADSLFLELIRRYVFKVCINYLALGWLTIETADTIFLQFQFPVWTSQLVTFLIILGFPFALNYFF